MPATNVSTTPSESICTIMSRGFAPMARRIPISCVRSFTITHMMFPTPMIPASRLPIPTNMARSIIPINNPSTILNCSEMSQKFMALWSSGCIGWLRRIIRSIRGWSEEGLTPSFTRSISPPISSPREKERRRVFDGTSTISSILPFIWMSFVCPATPTT